MWSDLKLYYIYNMRKTDYIEHLRVRFMVLLRKYGASSSFITDSWNDLKEKYYGEDRYYHDLWHLETMFREYDEIKSKLQYADETAISIFYHDFIYNPIRSDNEKRSAKRMRKVFRKTSFGNVDYCFEQILSTKSHLISSDTDTNYLLDMDLVILGKSAEEYIIYTQNVRKEYNVYPDILYKAGRRKVLNAFLSKERIYKTQEFIEKYEQQARLNMEEELKTLS